MQPFAMAPLMLRTASLNKSMLKMGSNPEGPNPKIISEHTGVLKTTLGEWPVVLKKDQNLSSKSRSFC